MTNHATAFTTIHDPIENVHFYKCDTCGERHTFKMEYMAKQWANRHGTAIPHARFCLCCNN